MYPKMLREADATRNFARCHREHLSDGSLAASESYNLQAETLALVWSKLEHFAFCQPVCIAPLGLSTPTGCELVEVGEFIDYARTAKLQSSQQFSASNKLWPMRDSDLETKRGKLEWKIVLLYKPYLHGDGKKKL